MPDLPEHYTVADILASLPMQRSTLLHYVRSGKFVEPVRIGTKLFFPKGEVHEWMERSRETLGLLDVKDMMEEAER